ncbi:uncharacterized protein J3R85_007330 [Psidium guajava]|nr:uncharacterized protein J3R85_007330 [Psidium guajava]
MAQDGSSLPSPDATLFPDVTPMAWVIKLDITLVGTSYDHGFRIVWDELILNS